MYRYDQDGTLDHAPVLALDMWPLNPDTSNGQDLGEVIGGSRTRRMLSEADLDRFTLHPPRTTREDLTGHDQRQNRSTT